jgi:type IV pilus assembly protein PilB
MVGEIRDQETAEIALESAETGHMVFSTLHTNSAAGAVTRFLDMDVPAYMLASSLSGVLAQRLLRKNCPHCLAPVEVAEALRRKYRIPRKVTFYEGQGCERCEGQGKKGRIGVYELIVADKGVREGIYDGVSEADLVDRARRGGMLLMFEDGLIKAMEGKVALAEVLMNVEQPAGIDIDGARLLEQADATWEHRGVHAPREPSEQHKTPRALVAGGSQAVRNLVRLILQAEGMAVASTASGRKALDFTHQHLPDLVVADHRTAEVDGIAIARAIHDDPRLADIAVMLLGDSGDVAAEAAAIEAGADDYILKPLEPERLIVRARRALDYHAEKRRLRRRASGT